MALPADEAASPARPDDDEPRRSLLEDAAAALEDGRTYVEAELAYQKSRALFVVDRGKSALVYFMAGALLALLTLIGLTVGMLISLAQLIGPWFASGIVVIALGFAAVLLLLAAQKRWASLMDAFDDKDLGQP